MNNQKGSINTILIVIIAIAVLGIGLYSVSQRENSEEVMTPGDKVTQDEKTSETDEQSPEVPSENNTAKRECFASGCSGQICSDEEVMTTCVFLPEFACYQNATCERQASGECGWTQTETLTRCINAAKRGAADAENLYPEAAADADPPRMPPKIQEGEEEAEFTGTVLAGTTSKLLDFTKSDYDRALAADKDIALYFYANWCPLCKAEFPKMEAAFDTLSDSNVVGFRVNFNDSQTDSDEEDLARRFGVAYQHTKVFLKGGERILKSPEQWETDRYIEEIQKNLL